MPSFGWFLFLLWAWVLAMMSAFAAGRMGVSGVALVVFAYGAVLGLRVFAGRAFTERAVSRIGTLAFWMTTAALIWYIGVRPA